MPLAPFSGLERKLVLAFDVGTTFSGVAYAILDPGEVPKVHNVTRFPGQENGDFKIPSLLWYTRDGQVHSVGAEARYLSMEIAEEEEDLVFVEWFKFHLRPDSLDANGMYKDDMKPLPPGLTVVDVFGDFLAYLFQCAKKFITETHPNGNSLWNSLGDRIDFVLSHPNGWEGLQQGKMRESAVCAGLIPDTDAGHSRIRFVTEGEASLHYCIHGGLASDVITDGSCVMIIDAGGGTVDLSTYRFLDTRKISVEEASAPDCILQGSTRVNMRAREFLQKKLEYSRYGNDADIDAMIDSFERQTKPTFKETAHRSYIKFGSMRDQDLAVGIRGGQLVLEARDVTRFFQPSLDGILQAVKMQRVPATASVNIAFLVGGFAASPWLYERMRARLQEMGINLSRPDNHTNKAVSEGAVLFFLENSVSSRVSRFTYGTDYFVLYDADDKSHHNRATSLQPSGRLMVEGGFNILLSKNEKVCNNDQRREQFSTESYHKTPEEICADIVVYRGTRVNPKWIDYGSRSFSVLCTVHADGSRVPKRKHQGSQGVYYAQEYEIVLSCGLTELKAQLCWKDAKGQERWGLAKIVYADEKASE